MGLDLQTLSSLDWLISVLASKQEPVILNSHNYGMWAQDMETLLKSKALSQITKTTIPDPKHDQQKFVLDGKKDKTMEVITTCILREIHFHTSGIDCPHKVWNELKNLFDKFDKIQVTNIKKELISLDPLPFEIIEDYLSHVKENHHIL